MLNLSSSLARASTASSGNPAPKTRPAFSAAQALETTASLPMYHQTGSTPMAATVWLPSRESLDKAYHQHELALALHDKGQWPAAEQAYRLAYTQYTQLLGSEHPYTASILYNMGDFYQSLQRYPLAESCYRAALAIEEKTLGRNAPSTLDTLKNLASLYHDTHRYHDAEPLYQEILARQTVLLGADHPDVATTQNDLAVLYQDMGTPQQANEQYQNALSSYQRAILALQQKQTATAQRRDSLYQGNVGLVG